MSHPIVMGYHPQYKPMWPKPEQSVSAPIESTPKSPHAPSRYNLFPTINLHINSIEISSSLVDKIRSIAIIAFAIAAVIGIGFLTAWVLPLPLAIGVTWLSYAFIGKKATKAITPLWEEAAIKIKKIFNRSLWASAPIGVGGLALGVGASLITSIALGAGIYFGEGLGIWTKHGEDQVRYDELVNPRQTL